MGFEQKQNLCSEVVMFYHHGGSMFRSSMEDGKQRICNLWSFCCLEFKAGLVMLTLCRAMNVMGTKMT